MRRVFAYSGQGSQYFHMGRELYVGDELFRSCFDRLDALATRWRRRSVASVLYDRQLRATDSFELIDDTNFAIPVIQLALTDMLELRGICPDVVLGTSLGEYTAAVVAGVLTESELFEMLAVMARAIHEHIDPSAMRAGMLTVFPSSPEEVDRLEPAARWLAGRVGVDTLVFSGTDAELAAVEHLAQDEGMLTQRLPVHYGFHGEQMELIRETFLASCPVTAVRDARVELVSCVRSPKCPSGRGQLFDILRQPFDFHQGFEPLCDVDDLEVFDLSPAAIHVRPITGLFAVRGMTGSCVHSLLGRMGSDHGRLTSLLAGA